MRILYLVGKGGADTYPVKYTSKKAPIWIKSEIARYDAFIDKDEKEVPADVAMAMWIAYHHPNTDVDCMNGDEVLSKKQLDPYDVVFVVYDGTEVFNCDNDHGPTCPLEVRKFERAMKTTDAFVYPYPAFQKYILTKPNYYGDLKRAGIPIADFFKITPETALKSIPKFRQRVENKGWKGVIVKPSYGGYALGIKVFKNFNRVQNTTLANYFRKLKKNGFFNLTVQEFIPTFGSHFEIRTYWVKERYACAVATLTKSVKGTGITVDDSDTFESEGGNIPDYIKTKIKALGREVIKSIVQYPYPHPMLRIDFGCCVENRGCDDVYFVNEVENLAANMLADEDGYPIVEKVAQACYELAVEVKGKPEPKGKKSHYKAKRICIYPP